MLFSKNVLTKRTEFSIAIRKKIAENLVRLKTDVTKARQYRKSGENTLQQKILSRYLPYLCYCLLHLILFI